LHAAKRHGLEPLFALLLLIEMLEFSFIVSAIESSGHIFPVRTYCLARHDLATDARLDLDLKLLARNGVFEPLRECAPDE